MDNNQWKGTKRMKLPKFLQPIDSSSTATIKRNKAVKTCGLVREETSELGQLPRHSHSSTQTRNKNIVKRNCPMLRCRCDPDLLDDLLTQSERRSQRLRPYEDPYQWTGITELPTGILDEKENSFPQFQNDSNSFKSEGADFVIVGVALEKTDETGLRDLEKLEASGRIANIRIAKAGMAFEVSNEGIHNPIRESSPVHIMTPIKDSKHQTGELENKLIKGEARRKERLVNKSSHHKTMIGKYKSRVSHMELIDKERHEKGVQKIQKQLSMANQRRDQYHVKESQRCRLRNSRIAILLQEKRHNIAHISVEDEAAQRRAGGCGNKNITRAIPGVKSSVSLQSKQQPPIEDELCGKMRKSKSSSQIPTQTSARFQTHLSSPLESPLTRREPSSAAAGDGLEPEYHC